MGQAFRDGEEYLLKLDRVNKAIASFKRSCDDGFDTVDELEHLMLASYKLWNYITDYMVRQEIWFSKGHISGLTEAMIAFLNMQAQWGSSIRAYPLAHEVSHLECMSRAAFSALKRMGHIK